MSPMVRMQRYASPTGNIRTPGPATGSGRGSSALWVCVLYWLIVARVIVPADFDYNLSSAEMIANAAGSPLKGAIWQFIWLAFTAICAGLVMSRAGSALRLLRANPFLPCLALWSIASVIWSIDPSATLARFFHLSAILLCCLAVSIVNWNPKRFQDALTPVLTVFLAGSLLFALIAPDLASDRPIPPDTTYVLHGLADQKNQLGAFASMGVILWLHRWLNDEARKIYALVGFVIASTCLILSRSDTSILATATICIYMTVALRIGRSKQRYMGRVAGGMAIFTVIYLLLAQGIIPGRLLQKLLQS